MKHLIRLLCLCGAILFSGAAQAATECSISAVGVAFGMYNPVSGASTDSTGSVTFECVKYFIEGSSTVSFEIELSAGNGGNYALRQMSSGADTLGYNLYTNASRITVWGDGTSGTATRGGTFNLPGVFFNVIRREQTFDIYGRIPASQNVTAGSYADTITVTVLY